jgi:hypothetical protein
MLLGKHRLIRFAVLLAAVAGAAAAQAQTAACPAGPPGWITAEGSGCKVWNPCPQRYETVTWSGQCVNGFAEGRGVLQWLLSGKLHDHYEGTQHAGKANGRGVFTFANGDRYEGDFRDGKFNGRGVYTFANGDR